MKRILPVLLLMAFLLLSLPAGAAAGTELLVEGPESVSAVGESFSVTVEISGNPGFLSAEFTLRYDRDRLECTALETGDVLERAMTAENPAGDRGARMAAAAGKPVRGDGALWTVSFTVLKPAAWYEIGLSEGILFDADGREIEWTAEPLVVRGLPEWEEPEPVEPETQETPFPDIAGHWGEQYILRAAGQGLFTGFEDGSFRPNEAVTRAQFVTVLWRMAGKPGAEVPTPFTDVPERSWYGEAIAWAYEQGLVNGKADDLFAPDDRITRQEAMKILFAYSGGVSGMESLFTGVYDESFADSGEIAGWAKPAMYWGYYNGILNGKNTASTLCPTDTATRAELAKILVVYGELHGSGII